MSESPNNSGSEGQKPLTFKEYLGTVISKPLLSPENAERVGIITTTLLSAGFGHAILGIFLSENYPEMFSWTIGAPAVLWLIGAVLRKGVSIDRNAVSGGLLAGVTISIGEGLIKADNSEIETGGVLTQGALGIVGLLAAAATVIEGKGLIQKLIHPQVGPVMPKE